jgi:predicted AAA+ superfamily ATPase
MANGLDSLYWSSGNTAEVDFLIQDDAMRVIPIEVKSGDNVQDKSLRVYMEKYQPAYAIRLSTSKFGFANEIRSIPLYAAFCIDREIR